MPIQIIETLKNIAHKLKHKLKNPVVNFRIYEHFHLFVDIRIYGSFSKIVDISVLKIKKFYIAILRHLLLDYINQSMTYV